jgi:hypothetical protein
LALDSPGEIGAAFLLSVDGGPEAESGGLFVASVAGSGIHTVRILARDAAGNVSPSNCTPLLLWTVDTHAPNTTVVGRLRSITRIITVSWSSNEPLSGVFYRMNASDWRFQPFNGSETTRGDLGLSAVLGDGVYVVDVRGMDLVGNVQRVPSSFVWTLDTAPLVVTVVGGPRLVSALSCTIYVAAPPDAAIWWSTNDFAWLPVEAGSGLIQVVLPPGSDGAHVLRLKGNDTLGREFRNDSAWSWVVDTTPPVAVVATPAGSRSDAVISLGCASASPTGEPDCVAFHYTVTVAVKDGACGNSSVVTHRGGVFSGKLGEGLVPLSRLSNGMNQLEVVAVDAAGNRQSSATVVTWEVTSLSDVTLNITAPAALSGLRSLNVTFRAAGGSGLDFEAKLDDRPWSEGGIRCVGLQASGQFDCSLELRSLAPGAHSLTVRSRDPVSGQTGPAASVSWRLGQCLAGLEYADVAPADGGLSCKPCLAGGNCTPADTTLDSMAALSGWWSPRGSSLSARITRVVDGEAVFFQCPLPRACLSGSGGNASDGEQCNTGEGFAPGAVLCGVCAPGHARFQDGCIACPELWIGIVLLVGLMLVTLVVLRVWTQKLWRDGDKAESNLECLQRIALNYFVILSSVGDFKAQGPALLRDAVGWVRPVAGGLSLGFYPIKCALGLDYYAQTWGTAAAPMCLFVVGVCVEVVSREASRGRPTTTARTSHSLLGFVRTSAALTLYLFYPSVVQSLLTGECGFACDTGFTNPFNLVFVCHDPPVEGVRYLSADLSVACFSGVHLSSALGAAGVLAGYALGFPVALFAVFCLCGRWTQPRLW